MKKLWAIIVGIVLAIIGIFFHSQKEDDIREDIAKIKKDKEDEISDISDNDLASRSSKH